MSDRRKRNRGDGDAAARAAERDREIERRALRLLVAGRDWLGAVAEATRQVQALETRQVRPTTGTRAGSGARVRRDPGQAPGRSTRSAWFEPATLFRKSTGDAARADDDLDSLDAADAAAELDATETESDTSWSPEQLRAELTRSFGIDLDDLNRGGGRVLPGPAARAAARHTGGLRLRQPVADSNLGPEFVAPTAGSNRIGRGGAPAPAATVFRQTAAPAVDDAVDPQLAAARAFSGAGGEVPFRAEMEARFGTSFADVRAHTGDGARDATAELGAHAFTVGNQIAFANHQPDRELVAHELAHVVQARGGSGSGGGMSRPGDALEHEADQVAATVAAGQPAFAHVEKYERRQVDAEPATVRHSPGFGRAPSEIPHRPRAPWGRAPATVATSGQVFRVGTEIKTLTITPTEIAADGKSTARAAATTNPVGKAIEWSFDGPAFGTTIDAASGAIVAGPSIAPEPKSVNVWVKAKADTATKKAPLTLWDEKYKKALDDYPKFIAGTYALPDFKPGVNGNFDALYTPAASTMTATMRIKFDYTNDKSTGVEKMVEGVRRIFGDDFADSYASSHGMWSVKDKEQFKKDFEARIKSQWHDRYTFQNVREPKEVWSKLGPVHVNLNLSTVTAGQHFTVTAHKGAGRAEVVRPDMKLYEGDLTPSAQFGNTGADELGRLNAIMPKEVLFDFDSTKVKAADAAQLEYTATYLRRATQPKFIIDLVGHASNPGSDAYNKTLSEKRAAAVHTIFVGGGAAAAHSISASGVGEVGASKDALWQKVDLTAAVDPAFVNKLDTAGHEFGHMLGVGDEYGTKGDKTSHWNLVKKAFGQKYADDVALKDVPGGGSIMRGGEEVRIYHYVTFWQALCESTLKAALPDPKFGYDDWKFNE